MTHNSKDLLCFTPMHHALLFTCIAKSVILEIGEKVSGPILGDAVKKYGEERGRRMALRAQKFGDSLTMDNYFAYGEWVAPEGETDFRFVTKRPHARLHAFKCPWYGVWKEKGLLEYGKYFCKEIDSALVRGFNPDLELEVNSTRTTGGQYCDFIFKDADLSLIKIVKLLYKKKIHPGKAVVMPWDYHTAHLFKTLNQTIKSRLDAPVYEKIMETACSEYAALFSEDHIVKLKGYQAVDFLTLPD